MFNYKLGAPSTAYITQDQEPAVHLDVFVYDEAGEGVVLHKSAIISKAQYSILLKAQDAKQTLKSLIVESDPEFTDEALLARQAYEAKLKSAQVEALDMAAMVEGMVPASTWLDTVVAVEPDVIK